MKTSEQINEIAAALAAAQGEMKNPLKDSDNPFFKSKYADLAANIDAAKPALAKHGIACVQNAYNVDGAIAVTTRLIHASGQWIETDALMATPKDTAPQSVGTCVSYMRRYQFGPAVGLAGEDDDGNASSVAKPAASQDKAIRRPPGTISRKETQPDHKAADAALEEAGKEVFGDGSMLPIDDRTEDPRRDAASKRAIGIAKAMAMVEVGQAKGIRERIVANQADGLITDEDAQAIEAAIVARVAELAGLMPGTEVKQPAKKSRLTEPAAVG